MRKRQLVFVAVLAAVAVSAASAVGIASADPASDAKTKTIKSSTVDTRSDLDDYWTPERMAKAKPISAPKTDTATGDTQPTGDPVVVDGTKPDGVTTQSPVDMSIGRLFFSTDDGDYICSANVVPSDNGSVLATARHCGFENNGRNYRFAPDYESGNTPHGWWDWKSAGWTSGGDGVAFDYAFIVLNKKDGRTVTDAVGSSGIAFNNAIDRDAQITGIPGATDAVFNCNGKAYTNGNNQQLMDDCNGMSGGASGGAWLQDMDGNSGYQVGTYFGSVGDAAAGSYFGNEAMEVWKGAGSQSV
ncbi:MAG: trypsin-like serine peptidase [Stackebrandtia sp.]